jgi:hypothetical protein
MTDERDVWARKQLARTQRALTVFVQLFIAAVLIGTTALLWAQVRGLS